MKAIVGAVGLLATTLLAAAPARAGTYDVWGCRLPDGRPAPTDGWQADVVGTGEASNRCAAGGALHAALVPDEIGYWVELGWLFFAPSDTQIDNFTVIRAAAVSGDREYHMYRDFTRGIWPPARTDAEKCITWFDPCDHLGDLANWASSMNRLARTDLGGTIGLSVRLECNPGRIAIQTCPATSQPGSGIAEVWQSRIGLRDTTAPALSTPPSGTLVQPGQPLQGLQHATFAATDRGGGLQTMGLLVDGIARAVQPVDRADGTCKPPYTRVVPCRLAAEPTLVLDTAQLANGPHTLRVTVTDVAGNATQSDPVSIVTRNGGEPNGANASREAQLQTWFRSSRAHRTSATVAFSRRRTIEGRLLAPGGTPIAAAVLNVSTR